ncbi:MAG TPA: dienelactone hydrolase family protein, partial [Caulobacteraceae bacterium]|nr:dienelactone hydrolase family protein [Caulobacteraceae bacterium]
MGEMITIRSTAEDGFAFPAYHAAPTTARKGGVIVIQEIFGIDKHVRADVERWAKAGYDAIAPSLYDRRQWGFTAKHDPEGLQAGIGHARATPLEQALTDIAACREFLTGHGAQKVCVVGYCYGGAMTWQAAGRIDGIAAASSYYGGGVAGAADLTPKCPVLCHFG